MCSVFQSYISPCCWKLAVSTDRDSCTFLCSISCCGSLWFERDRMPVRCFAECALPPWCLLERRTPVRSRAGVLEAQQVQCSHHSSLLSCLWNCCACQWYVYQVFNLCSVSLLSLLLHSVGLWYLLRVIFNGNVFAEHVLLSSSLFLLQGQFQQFSGYKREHSRK